jgi:hypothetical protein
MYITTSNQRPQPVSNQYYLHSVELALTKTINIYCYVSKKTNEIACKQGILWCVSNPRLSDLEAFAITKAQSSKAKEVACRFRLMKLLNMYIIWGRCYDRNLISH